MHNLDTSEPAHKWYNYNGSLVNGIDQLTNQFFAAILQQENNLPTYATLITHLSTKSRGLGIINASLRAAPDFVLTTMMSEQRATQGFLINKDLQPIKLHSSITDLYNTTVNKNSAHLKRYHHLLPTFAKLSCSEKCPTDELITRFEQRTSLHSARGSIKQYCDTIVTGQIFSTMYKDAPEHLHLLPSILSPQTSFPLIDMNRSNSAHRLQNWAFDIALRRKLRLPIFKHQEKCKCGNKHDLYGDHTFHCRRTSKKLAHNIIRDIWANTLQPALATAGYIHQNSKLDIEPKQILSTDLGA